MRSRRFGYPRCYSVAVVQIKVAHYQVLRVIVACLFLAISDFAKSKEDIETALIHVAADAALLCPERHFVPLQCTTHKVFT